MSLALTNVVLLSTLSAAVLGIRLRVFVIIPLTIFALPIAGLAGWAYAGHLITSALFMITAVISVQLGYMLGSALRFFIAAARMSARRAETTAQVAREITP
jgi:hypothetical protein